MTTPVPSRSAAETFVIASTAAFEGPLGENPYLTIVVSLTVRLMMLPDPRSAIRGANARVIKNTPLMLVSITSRHAAGVVLPVWPRSVMNRSLTNSMPRRY